MSAHHTPAEPLRAPVSRPAAAAIIAMLLTAFILIAVAVGSLFAAPRVTSTTSGAVTDGWSAYLGAAAAPAAEAATDGWSTYLMPARGSSPATDGWSSYLIGTGSSATTDGWLTRYGAR
jgi:hypothetical protein